MRLHRQKINIPEAEALALQGLTFLAGDPKRLVRFLSLTGLTPQDLKGWSERADLQAAVLEYLLSDESLLLVFAAETGAAPDSVAPAHVLLSGGTSSSFKSS